MSVPPLPPGFVLEGAPAPRRKRQAPGVPPPPPGFELEDDEPEAAAPYRAPAPSLDGQTVIGPVDGDTARLSAGGSLRLYGADAPELKQQGGDRAGQAVPIGQQSKRALGDMLAQAQAIVGGVQGQSYNRPVAPLTVQGQDVGEKLIRAGDALAAPTYMKADPTRSADYMAAERLARQNRLGLHGVYAQTPSDFRHNPQPSPDRETVAAFWDTPTPWAGLRPEAEQRILQMTYNAKVPLADIAEYAKANGGTLDMESAKASRDHFLKYGKAGGIDYKSGPKILTDNGDGTTGAAVRGVGTGALAGGLDEAGALVDSLGLTEGRENVFNSDRRFADLWANNQQQNAAILGFDKQESPYASTAGELAGGLVVPFGARASTVPELFRVGAAYGAAQGFLGTDGDLGQRAIGGAIGVPLGGALGAGAGKALQLAAPYAGRALNRLRGRAGEGVGTADTLAGRAGGLADDTPPPPPPGFVFDDAAELVANRPLGVANRNGIEADDTPPLPAGFVLADDADNLAGFGEQYAGAREALDDVPPPPGFVLQGADDLAETGGASVRGLDDTGAGRSSLDETNVPPPPPGFQLMADEPMPSISQDMRRPDYLFPDRPTAMDQPLTDAQRAVVAERIDPRDLTPLPSNEVGSVEEAAARDAGRYVRAAIPNERQELTRQTVRTWNGAEVPKVGPIDLVGWVRLRGGLADQGGELSHMGMTNAARRGMDFVGQEARFGPLVDEQGSRLDDAAEAAWEAGYFPDHTERPTTAEFLDSLRDTYEGRSRHFLPEDLAEVDRFYAAQGERQALEQQRFETGQPIVRDRSQPADEPQPFPPPEAFEEWGTGGGPDFAGNIRLGNLETPQDIARALSTIEKRVGFDAATRGRVSQAETARLAAELNMTPETLLARRTGQAFNAEEALAARQILAKSGNELVNAARRVAGLDAPGDELLAEFQRKLTRHVAIQEQIAGATAEAGRALQQFSMVASSNAVRKDVLAAMVGAGGGQKGLKNAADAILDASEVSPGQFNTVVEKLSKPTWRDKAIELMYIFKLSSPATHVVNAVGNTLTALAQPFEFAAASVVGKARQALPGANIDRVIGSEVGARAFGMVQGAKEGLPAMVRSFRTGEASDFVSRVERKQENALPGRFGHVARTPLRALTAADEFFKAIARRMELNGHAVRIANREGLKGEAAAARIAELSANPTDEMLERAMEYARYITYQTPLGDFGRGIQQAKQNSIAASAVVPFVRTPTNLFKFSLERSPLAPALSEWRKDFVAGGARRDLAIAKAVVGSGLGAAIFGAARSGYFTGSRPMDAKKSQFMMADGWQPYSLKVGDQYYSYSRLDPFATTLGVAADMATKADGMTDRQLDSQATLLTASIIKSMTDKVYLSGISDLLEAVNDWERFGPGFLRNFVAGNTVPAGLSAIERSVDPAARDARSVSDTVVSRIPGASSSLPIRRNIWGEPIISEGGVGPDIVSPTRVSTDKNDPINAEMLAINARFSDPERWIKQGGKRVDLNPEQYGRYSELAGKGTRQRIEALMADPNWSALPPQKRADLASDAAKLAKADARAQLFGGPAPTTKAAPKASKWEAVAAAINPPPPGFVVEGEVAGVNVYADIQQAIPGVRITSGFRTPEYQADMRRRGYKPADNSAHLDGSALDLLPPPGKSMGWLRNKVGAFSKAAKILNEGDHLHVIFPGYYGAPVLGGAKAAGLKNPNMGAPPPPPGFVLQ